MRLSLASDMIGSGSLTNGDAGEFDKDEEGRISSFRLHHLRCGMVLRGQHRFPGMALGVGVGRGELLADCEHMKKCTHIN